MSTIKKSTRKKLEAAGWSVGSAQDFLGLSDADAALVKARVALTQAKGKGGKSIKAVKKEPGL